MGEHRCQDSVDARRISQVDWAEGNHVLCGIPVVLTGK
jgi:hypothetical protein